MSTQKEFWNKEYGRMTRTGRVAPHLALSAEHSEDLEKFTRFLIRESGKKFLNVTAQALDIGCGNGRNLIYLAREFGMRGVGYDISETGIALAKKSASELIEGPGLAQPKLEFFVQSMDEPIPLPDNSVTLVLDMMSSHILLKAEREKLRSEILRVLKPGGWLFFKSFLLDDDAHARRLLRESPAEEEGMYIHPEIKGAEYVWTEEAVREFFAPDFAIHRIEKSFKHKHADGSAWKRRTITAYLEKVR
ncbi:MAG: class I SAM-dependent methyltransferase [Patescibacteria group bacterium]